MIYIFLSPNFELLMLRKAQSCVGTYLSAQLILAINCPHASQEALGERTGMRQVKKKGKPHPLVPRIKYLQRLPKRQLAWASGMEKHNYGWGCNKCEKIAEERNQSSVCDVRLQVDI